MRLTKDQKKEILESLESILDDLEFSKQAMKDEHLRSLTEDLESYRQVVQEKNVVIHELQQEVRALRNSTVNYTKLLSPDEQQTIRAIENAEIIKQFLGEENEFDQPQ